MERGRPVKADVAVAKIAASGGDTEDCRLQIAGAFAIMAPLEWCSVCPTFIACEKKMLWILKRSRWIVHTHSEVFGEYRQGPQQISGSTPKTNHLLFKAFVKENRPQWIGKVATGEYWSAAALRN